jgi:hypothetical protein
MMSSSTTLALGTGAGTLVVTALSALILGAIGMYTLLHHKEVLAWWKHIRHKDLQSAELDQPAGYAADLYTIVCGLAHKPCRVADFEDVARIGNMIKGIAEDTEELATELTNIVKHVEAYTATALPEPTPSLKVTLTDHHAQLIQAMKQEAARIKLERTVVATRKKINTLRSS